MILRKLELHNFGPYLGRHSIGLHPKGNESVAPITLIGGLNGCGKTSILDAIRLVLYGSRAKCSTRGNLPYKEFLRESVNRHVVGEKSAAVALTFSYQTRGVETEYLVSRHWTSTSKDVSEVLLVLRDGKPDTQLIETWDETVEDLIPIGISNLFLFDGEQVGDLAEQETPPLEVRHAIRCLLGLDLVDRLDRDLGVLLSKKRKSTLSAKALELYAQCEQELESERTRLNDACVEIAELEKQLIDARLVEGKERERFTAEGGELAQSRSHLEREKETALIDAYAYASQLRELSADVAPLSLLRDLLSRASHQAKEEISAITFGRVRRDIEERDELLVSLLNEIGVSKKVHTKIQDFLRSQNDQRFGRIDLVEFHLGVDERVFSHLKEVLDHRIPHVQAVAIDTTDKLEHSLLKAEGIEAKLAAASTPEDLERLLLALAEAKGRVVALAKGLEDATERKASLLRSVERLESRLRSLRNEQGDFLAAESLTRRVVREVPRVQETLLEYQKVLSKKRITQLEELVTKHYCSLMRKEGFIAKVKIDSDTYALAVSDGDNNVIPKQRLSAGEKQLLAVALLWGLSEASGRTLPMVVDTPLGRLDSTHRINLVDYYFPNASHQVVVLSTDTEFQKEYVDRLRQAGTLGQELLLDFDDKSRSSYIRSGYFC